MLRDQINEKVKKAEESIRLALQKFHDETGMTPTAVNFEPLDVRTVEEYDKGENAILIANVEVIANT